MWDGALPGHGSDTFVLSPDGRMLSQLSELHLANGGSVKYRCAWV
jgi:hypothetical protein